MEKYMKEAFNELAKEMELQCGDWQSLPDTEKDKKLRKRIITAITNNQEASNSEK